MVNFKPWAEVALGVPVRVNQPGNRAGLNGQMGMVLGHTGSDHRRKMVRVKMDSGTILVSHVSHLERIENMNRIPDLVGPKPEPVQEPAHPTPWKSEGRWIKDANGNTVMYVELRNPLARAQGNGDRIPMDTSYLLTLAIVTAMNEKYGKVEDSASPF